MCSKLQLQALKEMKNAYPSGRFWIKGDGCDIKPALQQSVKGVWNGDADIGDGTLQVLRTEYEERMKHLKNLTSPKNSVDKVLADLELCEKHLETDKQFLTGGLMHRESILRNAKQQTHQKRCSWNCHGKGLNLMNSCSSASACYLM